MTGLKRALFLVGLASCGETGSGSGSEPAQCDSASFTDAPKLEFRSTYAKVYDDESVFGLEHASPDSVTEVQLLKKGALVWKRFVNPATSEFRIESNYLVQGQDGSEAWDEVTMVARASDGECGLSPWSEPIEFRNDDGSFELFHKDTPLEVGLKLSAASYDAIAAEAKPEGERYPYSRDYYSVDVSLDDDAYLDAGGRTKGAGSARLLTEKAGLKVNLGWDDPAREGCGPDRRYLGQKRITLNNMVQDESFVRKTLGYQFYASLGLPVPRTQYAKIWLNEAYYGLYLNVESIDRRFLSRRFESKKGMLYEAVYGGGRLCDLSPERLNASGVSSCFQAGFTTDECDGSQDGYDVTDHSHLQALGAFIENIPDDSFYEAIGEVLDIDEYLTLFAAEIVVGAGDSHFYHHNNYRMYHDPSDGLWHIIATGIDTSFSTWLPPGTTLSEPVAYLAKRCIDSAPCLNTLVVAVTGAMDRFEEMDFPTRADALAQQLKSEIEGDPKKEVSMAAVATSVRRLKNFAENRRETVEALLLEWKRQP